MTLTTRIASLALIAIPCAAVHAQPDMVPLPDLGPGTYLGAQGGLYPNGQNTPPPEHLAAALAMASQVVPRNTAGQPDPGGVIGMVSIGMSNTNQEFGAFHHQADADTTRNARLVIVNSAQGGQDSTTIADPAAAYWTNVMAKVEATGLTAQQVQVAWLKEAKQGPEGAFPVHALLLRDELRQIAQILRARFPNLKLCYLSSRIYAGYAINSGNPEPFAYESGFSVKWVIEDQIDGHPGLNYGQLPGPVQAPLLLWGPYMWADGAEPNGAGLSWLPEDFEQNGTNSHPGPLGEQKVADLLAGFFESDATAGAWWPKQPGTVLVSFEPTDDSYITTTAPNQNFGAEPALLTQAEDGSTRSYLRFDMSVVPRPVIEARLHLRIDDDELGGQALVMGVENTDWSEDEITAANAPQPVLPALGVVPGAYSRGGSFGVPVSAHTGQDADGVVGFTVLADPDQNPGPRSYHSKEEGRTPRLVLTVLDPFCPADIVPDGVVDVSDLVLVIVEWGPCAGPCPADVDGDGEVGVADLVEVIVAWGGCGG